MWWKHIFGTGLTVRKHIRSKVIDFKPIDRRMFVLRIRGKFKNYSFICVHAPTEWKSECEHDQFYERLERMYKQRKSYCLKVIWSDMNAKVRKEIWTAIAVGTCSLHYYSNNNRTHLINYAAHQQMVIGSILFPHTSRK